MLSKNEIKDIQSLCHKKHRDETQYFIAEGPKLVEEILNSDFEIVHVYALANYLQKHNDIKVPFTEISEKELERISGLQTPHQVVLVAKQKQPTTGFKWQHKITLVLDGIQDPGNMGTIVRTADWFGINQVLCTHDCVELYNPKVVQATMGSITRVDVQYHDIPQLVGTAQVPVYGALLDGENVFQTQFEKEGILVIGNEGKGIREEIRQLVNHPVTIPKIGKAESLNAGIAAGIIMGMMTRKV
jgi:RNA methyltransferase, TrmH family